MSGKQKQTEALTSLLLVLVLVLGKTKTVKGPFVCTFKILIHIIINGYRRINVLLYCVIVNSRVVICTLSSAHWQPASTLSVQQRFEFDRVDLERLR